jgi:murein DD-endopeptidase MepM/ murein hydrolase activator NlpD
LTASIIDANGKSIGVQSRFFTLSPDNTSIQVSITAISSLAVPGQASIVVKSSSEEIASIPFTIEARNFVAEEIPLNPSNTAIRTEPDPRKTQESDVLWRIISTSGNTVYANDEVFLRPVTSTRKTSFYGDRRVYVYSTGRRDTSVHAGVDFGVPMKTEVKAAASGKVILAAFRIVTGNSVIIEHFPGVYSLYYHLNDIHVTEGTMITIGDEIGLSGTTGLSTGPHLHWEVRAATENADPDAFLARKLLDKDAIISKMELLKN